MGLGRAKTPQFVKPLTTPPRWRTIFPAVFAILDEVSEMRLHRSAEKGILLHFSDAPGSDLQQLISARIGQW